MCSSVREPLAASKLEGPKPPTLKQIPKQNKTHHFSGKYARKLWPMAHSPIWESGRAREVFSERKRGIGDEVLEQIYALNTRNRTSFETESVTGMEIRSQQDSQAREAWSQAAIESKNNTFCCLRIRMKFCRIR